MCYGLAIKQNLTFIADREADIFEVFTYDYEKLNKKQKIDFVIRALGNRVVKVSINNKEEKFKLNQLSNYIPQESKFKSLQLIPRSRERNQKNVYMDISYIKITIPGKKKFRHCLNQIDQ